MLILLGAGFLLLPECHAQGQTITFLDALFTSTSAVCVTGLIVVDTATAWSRLGQTVILILLQLGGIGIVSFGALFALLLGQRISFRQRALLKEQYGESSVVNILHIVPVVAGTTLTVEALGAICLYPSFVPKYGSSEGAYHAVFHAVSAFCNAGFSTFSNSLEQYQSNLEVNAVVAGLIVVGGLGFPVITELLEHRGRRCRLSLHTRVVLWSSGVLILLGALLFFLVENGLDAGFRELPVHTRVYASFFQSIAARTAGFNTVRTGALAPASLLILMTLMFIGGSPSGTAGGIKTTTFVASLAAVRSVLLGRQDVRLLDRRLERNNVRRALVLVCLAMATLVFAQFLLLLTGGGEFLKLAFETVSAFGTVGLSTGITPELTSGQRIVIILVMLVGRLGPMAFGLALARPRVEMVKYPETDLLTG